MSLEGFYSVFGSGSIRLEMLLDPLLALLYFPVVPKFGTTGTSVPILVQK